VTPRPHFGSRVARDAATTIVVGNARGTARAALAASSIAMASACSLLVDTGDLTGGGAGGGSPADGGGRVDGGADDAVAPPDGPVIHDVPSDIDGLELWIRSDGVTATTTGVMWIDLAQRHAVNTGQGCTAPAFVDDVRNGRPVIRFDGASTCLGLSEGFADFTDGLTIVAVMAPAPNGEAGEGDASLLDLEAPRGADAISLALPRSTSGAGLDLSFAVGSATGDALTSIGALAGIAVGSWSSYAVVQAAASPVPGGAPGIPATVTLQRGDELIGEGLLDVPAVTSRTLNAIGGPAAGSTRLAHLRGDVGELLVYRRGLAPTEVHRLTAYAHTRWGL